MSAGETVGIHVVFTDLVGSTELSNRLGPEATEALRVVHFGLLRGAMEAHNGSEVKNLGDGLMMVFPSLGAALDGSVAMQQAIERHNSSGKEALGIRVGISTGDATEEDGDYFGEPVVEAARLCAKCEAGQIITSELISLMARRSGHVFTAIGDLELRGVPEPVPSVVVDWEPVKISSSVPMPDRLLPDMDLQLAGRARESDALRQAFKSAVGGQRRLSFLAGEPGIGKTRLSSELATHAHAEGAAVLYGRCDEELSLPYQPWVEAVSYLLDVADPEAIDAVMADHGPELAILVPQIRRRFPDLAPAASSDPETERYMLLQAVTATFSILGADTPLLVVLDDLHWADKQTLTLLRHLMTNVTSGSMMLVVTYRDSDLGTGHPLLDTVAALRREPGVELMDVAGLDDVEMIELVQISAGHDLDENATSMAVLLRQETAGNPFFAHEILRNLVEVGDLFINEETERWEVSGSFEELSLPQSVKDVVGQRIARLGDGVLKTLSAAAVIGREFDLSLLAEVLGTDEDTLLDELEVATAAGVLAEVPGDERFRFPHTLARSTLASGLSEGRRRRMHRKIAEALEATLGENPGERAGELATHWLGAAVSVDSVKAVHYARLAGEQAQASLAPDEAVRWFTTALEHLDLADEVDSGQRAELLVELGRAQKDASDPGYRETLLEASALAQSLDRSDLMAAAAIANSRGFISKLGVADEDRIAAMRQALDAVGPASTAERAMLLATLISELEYLTSFEDRMAKWTEAEQIARSLGDPATLSFVLNRLCVSLAVPHTLELRLSAAAESIELADSLGDVALRFWSRCGAFQAALSSGSADEADRALVEVQALAAESGRPTFGWIAGYMAISVTSFRGDGAELERQAGENLELGTTAAEPDAFDYFAVAVMNARWVQGRGMELIEQVRQATLDHPAVTTYRCIEPTFLVDQGDLDGAAQILDTVAAEGFGDIMVNNVWSQTMTVWGMVAAQVGNTEAGAQIYEMLLPWAGQIAHNRVFSPFAVDSILGQLCVLAGAFDRAEEHFAEADRIHGAFGSTFTTAFDLLGRARLHQARANPSDADAALDCLARATALAKAHDHAGLARMAAALVDEAG